LRQAILNNNNTYNNVGSKALLRQKVADMSSYCCAAACYSRFRCHGLALVIVIQRQGAVRCLLRRYMAALRYMILTLFVWHVGCWRWRFGGDGMLPLLAIVIRYKVPRQLRHRPPYGYRQAWFNGVTLSHG